MEKRDPVRQRCPLDSPITTGQSENGYNIPPGNANGPQGKHPTFIASPTSILCLCAFFEKRIPFRRVGCTRFVTTSVFAQFFACSSWRPPILPMKTFQNRRNCHPSTRCLSSRDQVTPSTCPGFYVPMFRHFLIVCCKGS